MKPNKIKTWSILVSCIFILILLIPTMAHLDERQFVYDELGRLRAAINPSGGGTLYEYDAVGNLLSISQIATGEVAIISFGPNKGPVGTAVTIDGIGFSPIPSENQVDFGGVATVVISSTTMSIETTVPDGALTGPITVTYSQGTDTSDQIFQVFPIIDSISPTFAFPGDVITPFTINGKNLTGATDISFLPPDGITVANPPTVNAQGTQTTVQITVDPGAVTGGRIAIITNPVGSSQAVESDKNRFTIFADEPRVSDAAVVGVLCGVGTWIRLSYKCRWRLCGVRTWICLSYKCRWRVGRTCCWSCGCSLCGGRGTIII